MATQVAHQLPPNAVQCSNSGYFEITFFDLPDLNMQSVVCQVFNDVAQLLPQRLNTNSCGDFLEQKPVRIEIHGNPTGTEGARATPYYAQALDGSCSKEIALSKPYILINGGIPDFYGVTNFDAWMEIDLDFNWNLNTTINPVPQNIVDLYQLVLHETTHILGFASTTPPIGANTAQFSTIWDKLLHKTDGYDPNGNSQNILPILTNDDCIENCFDWHNPLVVTTRNALINNSCYALKKLVLSNLSSLKAALLAAR